MDEEAILNMSYDWFSDVLEGIGEFLNFEAVSNYAGNSFVEKSWDMIMDSNPMMKGVIPTAQDRALASFFNSATNVTILDRGSKGGKCNEGK